MAGEYRALGLYPRGHLMAFVRPTLPPDVRPAAAVAEAADGTVLRVTRWDGTTTLVVAQVESLLTGVPMPQAHD